MCDHAAPPAGAPANPTLRGWKQIGAFFDCAPATAARWERTRGLPVRRVPGKGRDTVFAFTRDLEAWKLRQSAPPAHPTPAFCPRPWMPLAAVVLAVALFYLLLSA